MEPKKWKINCKCGGIEIPNHSLSLFNLSNLFGTVCPKCGNTEGNLEYTELDQGIDSSSKPSED